MSKKGKYITNFLAITLLSIVGIVAILYLKNIYMWSLGPSFGFGWRKFTGWAIIGRVTNEGMDAGFRIGDRIIEVNGKPVDSLTKLRELVDRKIGSENRFTVLRDGKNYTISFKTTKFGLKRAALVFGVSWLLGVFIFFIGAFVFFTTSDKNRVWSFFFFCVCAGSVLIFLNHGQMWFQWMQVIELIGFCFLPATILHMCFFFPFAVEDKPKPSIYVLFPYIISLFFFSYIKAITAFFAESPKHFRIFVLCYLFLSIVIFLFVLFYRYRTTNLRVTKLKIKIVILGFFGGILLPLTEPLLNSIFNIYITRHIDLVILPFIIIFPLSLSYAIVKHDLFEIDVFIKRTTGYILSTGFIAFLYILFIFSMNRFLKTILMENQQLFNFLFILVVVFIFNPVVHNTQDIVDRLFYRRKYDYREPVKQLLKEITSIFELNLIIKRLLIILSNIIFIENIKFFIFSPDKNAYCYYDPELNELDSNEDTILPSSCALVKLLIKEEKEIQRDSLYEFPEYEPYRKEITSLFDSWNIEMILPFITHSKLSGFMALGKIKSGRHYNISDVDVLRIISDQVAIAMENVNLIKDRIEQEKIREELKIAGEIQRRMLPDKTPNLKDFSICPHFTPAREIGGDFYDFIEIPAQEQTTYALVLGDVSGHGISGALLMSAAHTICQNQILHLKDLNDLGPVMNDINCLLIRETKRKAFVALSICFILQDKHINIINAGNPSPLYFNNNTQEVKFLENEGDRLPFGITDNPTYIPLKISLNNGDVILFYTDGIVETQNSKGEFFSFDRLKALFTQLVRLDPDKICSRIIAELRYFSQNNNIDDDMTMIIVKQLNTKQLDTTLSIPIDSSNIKIVSQCAESLALLCTLKHEVIAQLKTDIEKVCLNTFRYGVMIRNYKMLISLFQDILVFKITSPKGTAGIVKTGMNLLPGKEIHEQLQRCKITAPNYCIELLPKDKTLENLHSDNIIRLVVYFI